MFNMDAANRACYPKTGTTVTDTINNIAGTLTGAGGSNNTPQWENTNGGVFDFDGVDDYIDLGDNNIFSFGNSSTDSPFSISSWINMDNTNRFRIANKYINPGNKEYIFTIGGTDLLTLNLYDNSSGGYIGRKYNTALTSYQGQWIHVACTYDGASVLSGIKLYLNGTRVDDIDNNSGTYTAMENTTQPFRIGQQSGGYANGKIANFHIYNRALSANEVLHNYNALKGRFGL